VASLGEPFGHLLAVLEVLGAHARDPLGQLVVRP
jgi:hypothetical protein